MYQEAQKQGQRPHKQRVRRAHSGGAKTVCRQKQMSCVRQWMSKRVDTGTYATGLQNNGSCTSLGHRSWGPTLEIRPRPSEFNIKTAMWTRGPAPRIQVWLKILRAKLKIFSFCMILKIAKDRILRICVSFSERPLALKGLTKQKQKPQRNNGFFLMQKRCKRKGIWPFTSGDRDRSVCFLWGMHIPSHQVTLASVGIWILMC